MYRHFCQLSAHVPCKRSFFPCIVRDYCEVIKSRKKRGTKVVSKLSDPEILCKKTVPDDIAQDQCTESPFKDSQDLSESSTLVNHGLSNKKKPVKNARKDDAKKSIKERKDCKSSLSESDPNEIAKMSLSERYGDSLNMPGMKPFSTSKKKKTILPEVQFSDKKSEDNKGASTENISKGGPEPSFKDTFDFSEVIPKLRSPSFRLEQKLDVPCEWIAMAQSWSPSAEFLDSILKFPIGGLEKSPEIQQKIADSVSCFVTSNKTATKVVPAVTTVLSKTMTPAQAFALKLWRERLTKQLGEEGFQQHKTEILTRGKQFHDTIQRYLHGESVQNLNLESLPLITGCWKSLIPILNRIDDVIAVESEVLHPQLLYRGVIDCIVEIKGQPFIVEWKHSTRKKDSLQKNYDSPVQLMAYAGAINSNASYPFGVKNALLVVAYDDGCPADVFLLSAAVNGDIHWQTWLKRLHNYWTLIKAEKELEN